MFWARREVVSVIEFSRGPKKVEVPAERELITPPVNVSPWAEASAAADIPPVKVEVPADCSVSTPPDKSRPCFDSSPWDVFPRTNPP